MNLVKNCLEGTRILPNKIKPKDLELIFEFDKMTLSSIFILLSRSSISVIKNFKEKEKRRTFKESKELDELDKLLPKLEATKKNLEYSLKSSKGDLSLSSMQLAEVVEKIKSAEERWLELSELLP